MREIKRDLNKFKKNKAYLIRNGFKMLGKAKNSKHKNGNGKAKNSKHKNGNGKA